MQLGSLSTLCETVRLLTNLPTLSTTFRPLRTILLKQAFLDFLKYGSIPSFSLMFTLTRHTYSTQFDTDMMTLSYFVLIVESSDVRSFGRFFSVHVWLWVRFVAKMTGNSIANIIFFDGFRNANLIVLFLKSALIKCILSLLHFDIFLFSLELYSYIMNTIKNYIPVDYFLSDIWVLSRTK